MDDYCGLTEQEANEALTRFLAHATGEHWESDGGAVIQGIYDGMDDSVRLHALFTVSVDSCRLILKRLPRSQQLEVMSLLNAQAEDGLLSWMLMEPGPIVAALVQVLGLGKGEH